MAANSKPKPLQPEGNPRAKTSHNALNSQVLELGRLFRDRIPKSGQQRLTNPQNHKENYFRSIIKRLNDKKADAMPADEFNDLYRALLDHHDEVVSTSTMREIVFGILEGHKKNRLTDSEVAQVDRVLDNVSSIRLPTEFVGYSTSEELMQHPTSPDAGYFADDKKTRSVHYRHDLERKVRFIGAVHNHTEANNQWTLESALKAGACEAILYTLNEMAAPITAADIKQHSLMRHVSNDRLKNAVEAREGLKKNLVELGGSQAADNLRQSADEILTRPWKFPGKNLRAASATRVRGPKFPSA
ncbi:hypothetical protein [Phenylobacterium sp.]|uniref:hypothetical protein n=1 Tax=Phenylobacterium sp. TaxID=1871053 RepID=UPI0025CE2C42|nr:hypothetical protein [Phenylobacterium sp.]MCA6359303.1 hypothetical protein [Phenylobacterium sp.]